MSESAATTGTNDEFTAFWNNVLVAKFERFRNILLDGLSYHSDVPLSRLELARGSRAVDVGCGWGDTAIELAQKVGPTGFVLGLDCCDAFLEKGRRDAESEELADVRFVVADVQTYRFAPEFDFCFSRFGMMFFANPVAAMRNIRSALKPGGELMFITWRPIGDNPWAEIPKKLMLDFLPPPGDDAQTCGPGPFSMASTEVVSAQLKSAGFVDAHFEPTDGDVMVGATVDQRSSSSSRSDPREKSFARQASSRRTAAGKSKQQCGPSSRAISATARCGCARARGRSRRASPPSEPGRHSRA